MGTTYLAVATGGLLLWMAWHRATRGTGVRPERINLARLAFAEVETAVLRLLATGEEARREWFAACRTLKGHSPGPASREAEILGEAIRQGQAFDRVLSVTPKDVGQMSADELGSLTARLTLWADLARGQQLAVDASRLRLEAFREASKRDVRKVLSLLPA